MVCDKGTFLMKGAFAITMPLMAERIRLTFDVSERVRRALNIYAARMGIPVGEVIEGLVVEHLPEDVAFAERSIAEGKPSPGPKRGRRPKGEQ
jgi:hypothetical protein